MKKTTSGITLKKHLLLIPLLILTGMAPLFAIEPSFTPPVYGGGNPEIIDFLNNGLREVFDTFEKELKDTIGGININPKQLIGAFAASSVFASTGAPQRAFAGYDKFAVTLGAMAGFQLPASPFSIIDEIGDFAASLEEKGDIKLGVNPQALNLQFGLNTSGFLLDGLYLGFKFGYMNFDFLNIQGFTFKAFSAGITANYQIFAQKRILAGLFLWRGLNVGTGFIYQRTNFGYGLTLDPFEEQFEIPGLPGLADLVEDANYSIGVSATPKVSMDFAINTYTIPLEAMTSLRLFGFLNLSVGGGIDIGLGNANLSARGDAVIDTDIGTLPFNVYQESPGSLSVKMGGKNVPSIFNPKLMASLGISIGPVILLDIPVTYYFLNNGYNVGVTLGFVW